MLPRSRSSSCTRDLGTNSIQNETQINVICQLLADLVKCKIVKANQVLVVTPNTADCKSIETAMANIGESAGGLLSLHNLQVATVDSIQGAEADIALANFPLATNAGLIKYPRRLNSMISLAKCAQYSIADIKVMTK